MLGINMNYQNSFNKICELLKKYSTADDYQVNYLGTKNNLTRFADNMLTQNIENEFEEVYLTSYFDSKKATLQTANLSEGGIKELIKRSEDIAKKSKKDVEYLPSLRDDHQTINHNLDANLLDLSPTKRSDMAGFAINEAVKHQMTAAGTFESSVDHVGVATKNHLQKYHIQSGCAFSATFDKCNEQTNCRTSAMTFQDLNYQSAIEDGIRDAILMQNKITMPPGKYDVLLSSHAYTELNFMGAGYGMDRKAYDKGYSAYNKKLGTQIAPEHINLFTDPNSPHAACKPFMYDGLSVSKNMLIENGILKNLPTSRFWGHQNNLQAFGISNLIMDGSHLSDDLLIQKIERGFYIKDIWYIRIVNPENLTLTGMTRNALFYIEDGKVKCGATHFRWNDSPMLMFERIKEVGIPKREQVWKYSNYMPPVIIKDFNLTSSTLF